MSIDKEAFKAEVYRRGREKSAARKRARRRALISAASVTVCLVLFVALSPSFGWWDSLESGNNMAADQLVPGEPEGGKQDEDMSAGLLAPQETDAQAGTMTPGEALPDPVITDINEQPDDEAPIEVDPVYSVELRSRGDGKYREVITDAQRVLDISAQLEAIEMSEHEEGECLQFQYPDGGFHITLSLIEGTVVGEYDWHKEYLYVARQDKTFVLTDDEYQALCKLFYVGNPY